MEHPLWDRCWEAVRNDTLGDVRHMGDIQTESQLAIFTVRSPKLYRHLTRFYRLKTETLGDVEPM